MFRVQNLASILRPPCGSSIHYRNTGTNLLEGKSNEWLRKYLRELDEGHKVISKQWQVPCELTSGIKDDIYNEVHKVVGCVIRSGSQPKPDKRVPTHIPLVTPGNYPDYPAFRPYPVYSGVPPYSGSGLATFPPSPGYPPHPAYPCLPTYAGPKHASRSKDEPPDKRTLPNPRLRVRPIFPPNRASDNVTPGPRSTYPPYPAYPPNPADPRHRPESPSPTIPTSLSIVPGQPLPPYPPPPPLPICEPGKGCQPRPEDCSMVGIPDSTLRAWKIFNGRSTEWVHYYLSELEQIKQKFATHWYIPPHTAPILKLIDTEIMNCRQQLLKLASTS
ncbi:uncharacterized protein [Halyomorpha halys]|uniref:uncharacterized protein n=1 Tax=Halyomorpha halys TaxID=286706 RepID=UPI0006D4DCD0|nr:vegetative cell wall protein gp1-like [Halyomorpha halys]